MPQILHIATHMGGGVGKALSGIAAYSGKSKDVHRHKILMLELPEKTNFIDICRENGVEVAVVQDRQSIEKEMLWADIVQLEWWHHPLMAELLYCFPQVAGRLVIWSHISGCNYPALPFEFVKVPHKFLFTSQYSYENPYWSKEQRAYAKTYAEVVNSSGGFEAVPKACKMTHDGFNIGYAGTLSYSKLHPSFIDICSNICIPDMKLILVGDSDNHDIIKGQAKKKGILGRIEFTGYVKDVYKQFSRFDVFAYPLNPEHFGTTENVLLEAMASGLPVVALNQCAEKYLIEHMETGLLANSFEEYAGYICYLYQNANERKRLGENARSVVLDKLSVEKTVEKLNKVYDEVLKMPKRIHDFGNIFGDKPYKWFLSCLGHERKYFRDSVDMRAAKDEYAVFPIENEIRNCRLILKEKSKSSISHFLRYFPDDQNILYWKRLIE